MHASSNRHATKVLLLENIHPTAVESFEEAGFEVEATSGALEEEALIEKLQGVSVLGIRSATNVTKKVLEQAPDLLVIGAFCIGTNQIDLEAASEHGVAVFNAPYANTRSVVELTMAEIVMLARRLTERSADMHQGIWNKSAEGSIEIRDKVLGIVGYGNIGSQLSILAESAGMHVCYYDTADKLRLGNAERCKSLDDLLKRSDFVTIHVDGRSSNKNLIGKKQIEMMKDGAYLINNSRGSIVDVEAMTEAINKGKLAGVAADVFPQEPEKGQEFVSSLRGHRNVILTPHIGGSTKEAQVSIAEFVSQKLQRYMASGDTALSVNLPQLRAPMSEGTYRLAYIHQNVPGVLAKLNGILTESHINVSGQFLATSGSVGYVIVDADKEYTQTNQADIKSLAETISLRVL